MDKLRSLHDAIALDVRDGMAVAMGCALESLIPSPPVTRLFASRKKI